MKGQITIAVLGLGEAGSRFANDLSKMGFSVTGWDPNLRYNLNEGVRFAKSNIDAAKGADIILSANFSAVSVEIAREVALVLNAGQIYCEMNTSSPNKKKAVFEATKSTNVQFVDLAIMAPVPPKGIKTPFLASGPGAKMLLDQLKPYDFCLDYLSDNVGDASTRKLLRSIVYKGVAAVIGEAVMAGKAFGLETYIREQIASVIGGNEELINRFLEGSYLHAERRIDEMDAVTEMLSDKKIKPLLSAAAKKSLQHLSELKKSKR
jgi:3-hydroxyisobutyrate dehydrogenase-like beta-hydroxyacid dehydrogenase